MLCKSVYWSVRLEQKVKLFLSLCFDLVSGGGGAGGYGVSGYGSYPGVRK